MKNRRRKSMGEWLPGRWRGLFGVRSENNSDNPLQRNEMLFQSMIQSINGIVWECTADLQFTYVSPQCRQILGYDPDRWCSTPGFWQAHIHPEDRERTLNYCSAQLAMGANHDFEYRMRKADGEYIWLRDIVTVQKRDDGSVQMCGVMFDVSREKKLEYHIKKGIEERERYLTYAPYLIGISNREGYFEMVNPAFTELLGYTEEELTSRPFTEFVHPDDVTASMEEYKRNRDEGKLTFEFENRYRTADGEWKWISWYSSHWIESEDRILAYGHDITSLKEANLKLQDQQQVILDSLKEKETLLSEVHHRVKNNLAVVSGMMILQAEEEGNEDVRSRLLASVGRIKAMATIHEQLYQSNTFSRLDFSENIRALIENIIDTFVSHKEIRLDFDCEPVELNINQAIPCSLVVNEVVTNSMKYAFDGRDSGVLQVRLSRCPDSSRIQMTITDNGVGLPDRLDKRRSGRLGMNLIDVLCEQLQAVTEYDSPGEGTRFMISFEPNDLKGVGNSSF